MLPIVDPLYSFTLFSNYHGVVGGGGNAYMENEATVTKMNLFFEEAFHSSCEGMMVNSLDVEAGYLPSKRSDSSLKVKRDYVEGFNDSLDLVPIGAWSYC
ncbi:putative DNA ligase (ATP) [Helianthus annuus]|uniref:DNA ligase (ATP) n=1 Tax=Helianthus annuus TaxID=4232 RepID=A0A9K3HR31_HELAN|nr:putative DNA ligase (ATP) [Helianthus annuus]KAJ0502216.1 putative DNA ligase (ATP) [Helianthus annuus]KAJ0510207.1 putative DNA ligase (ATP) [Helianthus annuus]KAJ0518139.1 putative DNA ligase (ATP) [Helianthus annuus]KAJ0686165.1 putative DNA ligase (ATP) [Helianthus annuus]